MSSARFDRRREKAWPDQGKAKIVEYNLVNPRQRRSGRVRERVGDFYRTDPSTSLR